jgi:serine phosphatase RsbU (regulator of sigma subunit)
VLHGLLQTVWLETDRFVAALALLVDGSGAVEASAAGLPFPMLRSHGTWSKWQLATAPPLGLPTNVPPQPTGLEFAPGDVLLAFTDGLSEAGKLANRQYQYERLQPFLQGVPSDAAGAPLLDALLDDVRRHVDTGWPDDDITVLCLWHPFPLRVPEPPGHPQ